MKNSQASGSQLRQSGRSSIISDSRESDYLSDEHEFQKKVTMKRQGTNKNVTEMKNKDDDGKCTVDIDRHGSVMYNLARKIGTASAINTLM